MNATTSPEPVFEFAYTDLTVEGQEYLDVYRPFMVWAYVDGECVDSGVFPIDPSKVEESILLNYERMRNAYQSRTTFRAPAEWEEVGRDS